MWSEYGDTYELEIYWENITLAISHMVCIKISSSFLKIFKLWCPIINIPIKLLFVDNIGAPNRDLVFLAF